MAILDRLRADGLADVLTPICCRAADLEAMLRCHSAQYIAVVNRDVEAGYPMLQTGDTNICPASDRVARMAVGGVLNAVNAVCDGDVRRAFCVVRPPGHHACIERGMGFCLYNSIAIAARAAQQQEGLRRVAIVDWDVHHGNGTQDIFYRDPSVMFCSTHQHPWYPGTGAAAERGMGDGEGTTLNAPLPAGSGSEILHVFERDFLPAIYRFEPDLVLISAGFDSRQGDPLGRFLLTDGDFATLTGMIIEIAEKTAGGRLVSVLEGGYSLGGLASAVSAHVGALVDGRG